MSAPARIRSAAGDERSIDLDAYDGVPDSHRIISARSATAEERGAARLAMSETTYGDALPWPKTHELFRMRPHEVSAWIGPNGDGKSLLLGQVSFTLAREERRVLMCSLEMDIGTQIARMARQALCKADIARDELDMLLAGVGLDLFFFDYVGQISTTRMLALVRYGATELQAAHVVIDNLTMIVPPGRTSDEDSARFVAGLVQVARETGVHIHIVGHVRKPEDDRRITRYDWRGTGACPDMVHNVLMLQSNRGKRLAEDDGDFHAHDGEPDHWLTVDKQRNGGFQSRFGLWWRVKSLSWSESGLDHPIPIDPFQFQGA